MMSSLRCLPFVLKYEVSRDKEKDLTESYDKSPYTNRKKMVLVTVLLYTNYPLYMSRDILDFLDNLTIQAFLLYELYENGIASDLDWVLGPIACTFSWVLSLTLIA